MFANLYPSLSLSLTSFFNQHRKLTRSAINLYRVATILGRKFKESQGLSITFYRPIPTKFYHVMECLWHHIKPLIA